MDIEQIKRRLNRWLKSEVTAKESLGVSCLSTVFFISVVVFIIANCAGGCF